MLRGTTDGETCCKNMLLKHVVKKNMLTMMTMLMKEKNKVDLLFASPSELAGSGAEG